MRGGKATFDPKKFLAKVGGGKTESSYRKDQIVFSQGEIADAVFCIQQGKVISWLVAARLNQGTSAL
jgi:CRP/FNR family cyclic AMP-dependent transcriptional regulator